MAKLKVALIGLGNRGGTYAHYLAKHADVEITALCDCNEAILLDKAAKYNVIADNCFVNEDDFWKKGKLADALIIATQDRDHYGHAIKALNLGYHLLCEKPISPVLSQIEEIVDLAEKRNLKVIVCHVLRYTTFYDSIKKILDKGTIGHIVSINQVENVGYWHYSHSYVRGNWRKEEETSPSILAKCCHDLDIIYYFTNSKRKTIYSYGSNNYFKEANAPIGAPMRCLDGCPHSKQCPYHVKKIYYGITRHTIPLFVVKWKTITKMPKPKRADVINALKTSSPYGRCVFHCDNNVMESQIVAMTLENDVTATFTMNAFSKKCCRYVHIMGTKGEIKGIDKNGKINVNVFGDASFVVKCKGGLLKEHLGGDCGIVNDFVNCVLYGIEEPRITHIRDTIESHRNAIQADILRLNN